MFPLLLSRIKLEDRALVTIVRRRACSKQELPGTEKMQSCAGGFCRGSGSAHPKDTRGFCDFDLCLTFLSIFLSRDVLDAFDWKYER